MLGDDLRLLLFEDCAWYRDLDQDTKDLWVAWRITKSDEPAWWRELLIVAAAFARDHDLLSEYRRRFAGISAQALSDTAGKTLNRSSVSPIWEIANELIVGRYLEKVLGWIFRAHEPEGYRGRKGEWQFESPSGREVFVEVKSLVEREFGGAGVYSRGIQSRRLTSVLKGAYKQLPRDGRSTLVVIVGSGEILRIPFGITHGDLFQTLYGATQITFNVMPYVAGSEKMGPSFYDMFAHAGKHRRLGCVAGLKVGGLDTPGLGFYAIHNPFAAESARLTPQDFDDARQFWVDSEGLGLERPGENLTVHWARMAESVRKDEGL